jgi:Mrp family chromosome partitioning ATPase/capsular polysaccharide biosynthesis protein
MVLTYLRLHWLTILGCGLPLGAVLAYVAYSALPVKYESYALLQVQSNPSVVAGQAGPNSTATAFAVYIKTATQVIRSELVLSTALSDPKYKIAQLPTLTAQKDPIRFLEEKLDIRSSDGSEVVRISLEGDRPDDIRMIVDAVKDAYYSEIVLKEILHKSNLKQKVEEEKTKMEGRLVARVGDGTRRGPAGVELTAPPAAPPDADPGVVQAGGLKAPAAIAPAVAATLVDSEAFRKARAGFLLTKINQHADNLEKYPSAISLKKKDIADVKQRYEAVKAAPVSQAVLAAVEKDPDVQRKLAEEKFYRGEYDFKRRTVNDPNAPGVMQYLAAADKAKAEAERLKKERANLYDGGKRDGELRALTELLARLERELYLLQEAAQTEGVQLTRAKEELARLPADAKKDDPKVKHVDPQMTDELTMDGVYAKLAAQQLQLELELQSPPRVRILQSASAPSQKDPKKQIIATVVAGLLGFALVGLGVVATETRAKRVCSLAELTAVGSPPVVGVIPWNPDGSTARDPVARADAAEAVDKLRGAVVQNWLGKGAATVAVTSPLGDEGKAFTAFSLAGSLAAAGYKTLLVDFDLRNPALHPFAGVPNEHGVCELLRGETDPRQAMIVLPNGMTFVPAGNWSEDARRAAVGGRLEVLIARLRDQFDCVILHGHALLTVAESVEVARRCDAVLLCTLYRETRLPLLRRAADRLTTMEVPHTGVVYLGASAQEALC